jgi:DNA-binding transcriptional MerR regulator
VPKPTTRGKHRLYTDNQVDLLDSLHAAIKANDDVETAKAELWANWNLNNE